MTFSEGERIVGRYEVRQVAGGPGCSGMDTVYVCFDHADGKAVALETWQDGAVADADVPEPATGDAFESRHHVSKGVALSALGMHQPALGEFKQAAKLTPNDPLVYLNAGVTFAGSGDIDSAEKSYRKALALDPDLAEAWNNYGVLLKGRGELDAAEEAFRRAMALDARLIAAFQNIGVLLSQAGRHDEAIALLRDGLTRDPLSAGHQYVLGIALDKAGRVEEAVPVFEEAIRLRPREASYHHALGDACRQLGAMERALVHWQEAANLAPTHAMCRFNLGIAHERAGDIENAYRWYREAIGADACVPNPYYNLGLLLARSNLFGEAAQMFECFIEHLTPELEAHEAQAREYIATLSADEARVQAQIAQYPEAVHNRGYEYLQLGRLDEARTWLDRALAMRPRYARALTTLGIYYEKIGNYAESARCHRRSIDVDPTDAWTWNNLGWALYLAGDLGQARVAYAQCFERAPQQDADLIARTSGMLEKLSGQPSPGTPATHRDVRVSASPVPSAPALGDLVHAIDDIAPALDAAGVGDAEGGLSMLTELARTNGTAEAYNLLGEKFAGHGRFDEALDAYFAALDRDPDDLRALLNIGRAFAGKGEYDNAIGHYEDLQAQYPNSTELARCLADARSHHREHDATV